MRLLFFILLLVTMGLSQDSLNYNRNQYRHWIDADKNCRDTRQEVLVTEHIDHYSNDLKFVTGRKCKVVSGFWYLPYSGEYVMNPKVIDVDHLVPLKDAHISGAKYWDKEKKKKYANYLHDPNHLLAVHLRENRSKGSKSPEFYLPPNKAHRKKYCKMYAQVKIDWGLTVTKNELDTMKKYIGSEFKVWPEVRD